MSQASCPICEQPADARFRPFCSARCADLDLHRWLSGRYVVAGSSDPDDDPEVAEERAADEDDED